MNRVENSLKMNENEKIDGDNSPKKNKKALLDSLNFQSFKSFLPIPGLIPNKDIQIPESI